MRIGLADKIHKNDSIETALLKKTNNKSLSSKTLNKLVRISVSTIGMSKLDAKAIFKDRGNIEVNEHTKRLGELICRVLPHIKNKQVYNQYNTWRRNCFGSSVNHENFMAANPESKGEKWNNAATEKAIRGLQSVGINIRVLPETYAELSYYIKHFKGERAAHSISSALETSGFNLKEKIEPDVLGKISRALLFNDKKTLLATIVDANNGKHEVEFEQKDFVGNNTLRKNGMCLELSLKWLTEKENHFIPDFFENIYQQDSKEEVMWLTTSLKKANPDVIPELYIDYVKSKGITGGNVIKWEGGLEDGRYALFIAKNDMSAGHVVSAYINHDEGHFSFFDPGSGQFRFDFPRDFDSFVKHYLSVSYDDYEPQKYLWKFDLPLFDKTK